MEEPYTAMNHSTTFALSAEDGDLDVIVNNVRNKAGQRGEGANFPHDRA